jgi:hypothetical protein
MASAGRKRGIFGVVRGKSWAVKDCNQGSHSGALSRSQLRDCAMAS